MGIEVSRLRRLSRMAEAAAGAGPWDGSQAPVLTGSYDRIRRQVLGGLEGELLAEFCDNFPDLVIVAPPDSHPRVVAMFPARYAPAATEAATLLRQMAGWLDGLIAADSQPED